MRERRRRALPVVPIPAVTGGGCGERDGRDANPAAEVLGVDFGCALDTVPGAGHSNALMAARAAEILAR